VRSARFLVALLAASPLLAAAPDWRPIGGDKAIAIYVDANNIKEREGHLTAWVRVTFANLQRGDGTQQNFRSLVQLTVIDCENERHGVAKTTYYSGPDGTGNVVNIDDLGLPLDLVELKYDQPETAGSYILEFVCAQARIPTPAAPKPAKERTTDSEDAAAKAKN
jgi:hypothetical protein